MQPRPIPAFTDNYIWTLEDPSGDWLLVDPGEAGPVLAAAGDRPPPAAILLTHHHADHVGGNAGLLARWKVPVYGPHDDRITEVTHRLRDGERFTLPHFGIPFEVAEIPGHTRSHISFHGGSMLFCGDTLFAAGCGRLFEGTPKQMHDSLSRLMQLPDDTRVYCGHEYTVSNVRFALAAEPGNAALTELETRSRLQRERDEPTLPSTIAQEKATNPFVRVAEPEIIASASREAGRQLTDPVSVLAAIREWKNRF